MTHDEALELLTAQLAGELTPNQAATLQAWIGENPDHRILAEAFQMQDAELRQTFAPRREASAVTAERVVAQLPSTAAPEPVAPKLRRRRWLALIPPVAAAAALAAVLLFWMRPTGPSPDGPARAVAQDGEGYTKEGLKPKPKPRLPKPTDLALHQTETTKAGEKRRVKLPDGSIVYLNEKTCVKLVSDRQLQLTTGEVFVEATEANDQRGRFTVETPDKTVTALGTKFEVRTGEKGTGVLVTQGKVEVTGLEAPITTGHELAAGTTDILTAPRASHALDWTRELMIAADSPLVPAGRYDGGALVAVDPYGQEAKLSLVKYHIDVHIEDGFARTTIDQTYFNHENFQMEGTFYFPLPPDASLSRLAMYVSHGEESTLMEGGMSERNIARQTYEKIRFARRDPALLEWVDGSLFKMRVFPLEGRQEKRIILSYSQKLPVSYGKTSYRFPAGHSLNHVRDWSFKAFIKDGAMLTASSPSHPDMKIQKLGTDLVLTDKQTRIKADKDVLVDLYESNPNATPSIRWSSAQQDGHKYLMLRYRPQLPGLIRRERRDWVVLFEASGARDPLVARAQIEILRSLLNNAEHDDTLALMTVGTRIHKFAPQPLPLTPDNLAAALKFLEQTQLIGALNLEGALREAQPWLQAGQNPHLVHMGGGVATLGEQRTDKLIPILTPGTRYVGVGVGKRVSPAFMKVAAEKTGGLFTQINPDEPIAWRGFELASTLNTPRLLNVTVSAGEKMPGFLTFTNSLAHGEELAAVVRIDDQVVNGVHVRGTVAGETFERMVPIQETATKADYLPRTWAKLEIDRLMAENIREHRQTITELSKAMYVMTPFTSLLVLENDAMYQEFKIDRGRKDHWAMYGCPAKMPTVYIPDPNQPAGTGIQRVNQKPHANEVLQTIRCRTMPRYLSWPNNQQNDSPVLTAGQLYRAFAVPQWRRSPLSLGLDLAVLSDEEVTAIREMSNLMYRKQVVDRGDNEEINWRQIEEVLESGESSPTGSFTNGQGITSEMGSLIVLDSSDSMRRKTNVNGLGLRSDLEDLFERTGEFREQGLNRRRGEHFWMDSDPRATDGVTLNSDWGVESPVMMMDGSVRALSFGNGIRWSATTDRLGDVVRSANTSLFYRSMQTGGSAGFGFNHSSIGGQTSENGTSAFANLGADRYNTWTAGINVQVPLGFRLSDSSAVNDPLPFASSKTAEGGIYGAAEYLFRPPVPPEQAHDEEDRKRSERLGRARDEINLRGAGSKLFRILQGTDNAPAYYSRPSFSGFDRVFTDLVAYAPGMTSLPADIQAVLETEAAPRFGSRRGEVSAAAKLLIDRARTSNWHVTSFGKDNASSITHDGRGRFSYQRKLPFGVKEQVVCDGTTLWHLYPELGIGASRVVSRFHRAELAALLPDVLPPAEDLTVGADVVDVAAHTVAIVPLETIQPGAEDLPQAWAEVHLVFEGNRLAERRTVLLRDKKINDALALRSKKEEAKAEPVSLSPRAKKHQATGMLLVREVYALDGGIKLLDAKGKEIAQRERRWANAQPANVAPDLHELVVLPVPFRNRATIYPKYHLDPNFNLSDEVNKCVVVDLTPEAMLEVLAADLMENRADDVKELWTRNFYERGDRRRGFYTLLAAAGQNMQNVESLLPQAAAHPHDPLLRYLFLLHDDRFHYYQNHVGILPGKETPNDFLNNLLTFRAITIRWRSQYIIDNILGNRESERKRALAFVHRHADNVWGWCVLTMVGDWSQGKSFRKQISEAWGLLAKKSALPYRSRYEQARFSWLADDKDNAREQFKKLFTETLDQGILPPLDFTFRRSLEHNSAGDWSQLMNSTAMKALEKNRPLVVLLAWRAKQLDDHPLADQLLNLALTDMKPEDRILTTVTAIEYLWNTNEVERASTWQRSLLDDPKLAKSPLLWRLSSKIAERRSQPIQQYADLEKALDLEFAVLPDTFNVETIRRDYGQLLAHYQWLAEASVSLKVPPPADLIAKTIRYADRWRSLDPEVDGICDRTAKILRTIGGAGASALAWDYLTTPLAMKPNESAPWLALAESAKREGDLALADRCYREAYTAEPTNAQILWDRAQLLQRRGREAEARQIMQQIVAGDWQDRFSGVKLQARQIVGDENASSNK